MTVSAPPPPPNAPHASLLRWIVRTVVFALALFGVLLAGAWWFLSSEASVAMAARELTARSDGRLEVEGASGSLLDTVRVRRLTWRGPSSTAVATDVVMTWSPFALWSRGIVVRTFEAQRLDLDVVASDSAVAPPVTLALPLDVLLERVAIAQLDWHVGANRGRIDGLAFAYTGGADAHKISALSLAVPPGRIAGELTIGANLPFPIGGKLAFNGAPTLKHATASLSVSGTLEALTVEGSGEAGAARISASARLTPLGSTPLSELSVDATGVDLAAWDPALPETRIGLVVRARPAGGGLEGHIDATNAADGYLGMHRVPLRTLSARFSWRQGALDLDDLAAELSGSGRATGNARIPLAGGGAEGKWSLAVREIDLQRLYAPLITTRLSGSIDADLDPKRQRIVASVADRDIGGGLALQVTAVIADGRVDVERFRARAGTSELAGRGSVEHGGENAFSVDATAARFDPSRFGDFPAGKLDGTLKASGAFAPAWHVDAQVAIAAGSKLAGVAVSGTARGAVTRESVRNAAIDLAVGSARIKATGNAGKADDDRLSVAFDAPHLADLVPLLPPQVPRALTGSLHAKADVSGVWPGGGIDVNAKGEALSLDPTITFGRVDLHAVVAPDVAGSGKSDPASRAVDIDLDATRIVMPGPLGTFATAHASVNGTLAQHKAAVAFKGEDLDVAATAHGGLIDAGNNLALATASWSGAIDTLENRGPWALRLTAPCALALSRKHIAVGDMRLAIADGNVHLNELAWNEGKIATDGTFSAVPLASVAHLAGQTLPFRSTLTLGGAWSLAAAPRLNGTVTVRREAGDLWIAPDGAGGTSGPPLGVTTLEVGARITDDAIDASATFRSMPAGSADARLTVGVAPNAPLGHIDPDAPLTLTASADLPTLQLLQPWIGTIAVVDGRAHANLSARGTVRQAPFSGAVRFDDIRVDAPQYGVHFTDGHIAAHLAEGKIVLDDMQLLAGAGKFRASGTMVASTDNGAVPTARLAWQADKFRLFNRPDLHLVVDGEGTVALQDKKLALAGKLRVEEGRIVYVSDPNATLGDDVVVKGWARPTSMALRAADMPLTVDLALDFGDKLTFASQGLDTGLQGVVNVTSGPAGFSGKGTIRAVNGTYFAFGQKLVIDPGRLIFDGPLDNPGLDIVALRKNLSVEAGVAVSGTVKVPVITLTSNPPVPDGEKLSWLVLGQGLDRTSSSTDLAALQAASAALLGRNAKPVTATIAQSFGLDDITFKSGAGVPRAGSTGVDAGGQVVALGKRLSENLTLVYEQGLTVATNALRIEYNLSHSITLRAEAGTVSGAGIYYRRSFE